MLLTHTFPLNRSHTKIIHVGYNKEGDGLTPLAKIISTTSGQDFPLSIEIWNILGTLEDAVYNYLNDQKNALALFFPLTKGKLFVSGVDFNETPLIFLSLNNTGFDSKIYLGKPTINHLFQNYKQIDNYIEFLKQNCSEANCVFAEICEGSKLVSDFDESQTGLNCHELAREILNLKK